MKAARLGLPAVFAFRLIKSFAESADKDLHISLRYSHVMVFFNPLEFPFDFFIFADRAFGTRRSLDTVVNGGNDAGCGVIGKPFGDEGVRLHVLRLS